MSRVISGKDATDVRPWSIPDVENVNPKSEEVFQSTGEQFDPSTIREQNQKKEFDGGYNEGFAKGYAEGKQAAEEELVRERSRLVSTLNFLARPVENLDEQVEHELLELSLAVAKQVLKREVSIQPMHIVGLIRTSVARLPVAESEVTVHLNPDDAKIIRKSLKLSEEPQRWRIIDDPGLDQGSCVINSDSSFVDGSVDAMVKQVALDLFGGQRERDRSKPPEATDE